MAEEMKDEDKIAFIEKYLEDDALKNADEETRRIYKEYVEEGCAKNWPVALHAKGYGCYGGDEVYETDWYVCRDCMQKLIELTGNPFYYNTMGYLYYYGRCNDGVPEYEKAFQYFAVGAAHGVYESLYKMADMFSQGKGVPMSKTAAVNILGQIYDENLEIFCKENFDGKLADVALRVGGFHERGEGVDRDDDAALYFYLQARCAIRKRMERYDFYGDGKVRANIEAAIERMTEKVGPDFGAKKYSLPHPGIVDDLLDNAMGLDISLQFERGHYYLSAKRVSGVDNPAKALITVPRLMYSELMDEVRLELVGVSDLSILELPANAFINNIYYNEDRELWEFQYRDMTMLSFKCREFVFSIEAGSSCIE